MKYDVLSRAAVRDDSEDGGVVSLSLDEIHFIES